MRSGRGPHHPRRPWVRILNGPGWLKTPVRVENSLRWLTRGYEMSVADAVGDAVFEENHSSMILVRDIEMYSLCEHHLLPFFGRAHVAYIPDRRILGLSKLPRIVEVFARRLQVQERLERSDRRRDHGCPPASWSRCAHRSDPSLHGDAGRRKAELRTVTSAVRGIFRTATFVPRRSSSALVHGRPFTNERSGRAVGGGDRCVTRDRSRRSAGACRRGRHCRSGLARSLKDGTSDHFRDVACDLTQPAEVVPGQHRESWEIGCAPHL